MKLRLNPRLTKRQKEIVELASRDRRLYNIEARSIEGLYLLDNSVRSLLKSVDKLNNSLKNFSEDSNRTANIMQFLTVVLVYSAQFRYILSRNQSIAI